jgi:iron complex transport system substrate-binding protein
LIGVDSTSLWPPSVRVLPKIGYLRALATEGILSLGPSLVLVNEQAGPPAVLDQLRKAGVRIEEIRGQASEAGTTAKIVAVGAVLNRKSEAQQLAAKLTQELRKTQILVNHSGPKRRVVLLMAVSAGGLTAAGDGTAAHAVIELAGATNALAKLSGYRSVTPEAMLASAPEVILVPGHVASSAKDLAPMLSRPGLSGTPAARTGQVVLIDAAFLLGFGPRLAEAVRWLHVALYGDGPSLPLHVR